MHRKHLFSVAALVVVLLSSRSPALSQDSVLQVDKSAQLVRKSADVNDDQAAIDQDLQLLRKELRSQKKQIVAANMKLTDAEAEKFWPIYDQYAAEMGKVNDTKSELINNYWQTVDTMSGDEAEAYVRKRAAVEQSLMQVRLKYIPIFRKVLSGRQTALFYQIDWRLGVMIELQLAKMPLIDP